MRSLFLPAEQLFCFRPLFFYNLLLSKYKVLFNVFPICGRQQRTLGFWCFCPLQVKWICANVIPMFFLAKKHFEFETKNKCFHATRLEHVWCPCVWFPVFQSSLFALCFSIFALQLSAPLLLQMFSLGSPWFLRVSSGFAPSFTWDTNRKET